MERSQKLMLQTYADAYRIARNSRCKSCSSPFMIVPEWGVDKKHYQYWLQCTGCQIIIRNGATEIQLGESEHVGEDNPNQDLSPLVLSRAEQFWSMIHIPLDEKGNFDVSACWNWIRSVDRSGYGWFRVGDHVWRAHRFSYLITHPAEPLKRGWVIAHRCDNPSCCNPTHAYQGSYAANYRDALLRGRLSGIKMTVGKVLRLIRLAQQGSSIRELALLFGIQGWQVAAILRGYSWGNITGKKPKHPRKRKPTDDEEGPTNVPVRP